MAQILGRSGLLSSKFEDANISITSFLMSHKTITPKVFLMLVAIAMFLSSWILPTFLWQFSLIGGMIS
jgi:hypothetical protein